MISSRSKCAHDGTADDTRSGHVHRCLLMAFMMNARLAVVILVVIPLRAQQPQPSY
ncbi:MAG: hypothetical protein ACLR0U_18650 [Enterocloster clostridioformis]